MAPRVAVPQTGAAMSGADVAQSDQSPNAPSWSRRATQDGEVIALAGDWVARTGHIPDFPAEASGTGAVPRTLGFDTSALGTWDSGLIAFLWDAKRAAVSGGGRLDDSGLPVAARKLLALLPEAPAPRSEPQVHRFQPLTWLGDLTVDMFAEVGSLSLLFVETVGGTMRAVLGRAQLRAVDFRADMGAAGPSALIIVGVVNFLIGAILAFVGAVQLRRFAADVFAADLVGLAVVREMAAVMTAIIMSGRTGGAYAARIATMQGNEELDALAVVGIPVSDYIVLPSVLALTLAMPLLYLYGCLLGMFGGLVVSLAMLNVTVTGYVLELLSAVPLDQFVFGVVKSIAFGLMIGVTSCRIGLLAGRSAADVGVAATRAVVIGIVGVIALDAVFAVLAEAVGM
jgi:phospholipid/cholesterol/gamma-HCH transport system permease protein